MSALKPILIDRDLPGLYLPWPKCGHCLKDVEIEDGSASCLHCLIQFSGIWDDAEGTPDINIEGSDVPCLTEREAKEYDHKGDHVVLAYRPCILPSGHSSHHLCPYTYTATPIATGGAA